MSKPAGTCRKEIVSVAWSPVTCLQVVLPVPPASHPERSNVPIQRVSEPVQTQPDRSAVRLSDLNDYFLEFATIEPRRVCNNHPRRVLAQKFERPEGS